MPATVRVRQGGFSLLELLVAFAILALCISVLLRIFAGDAKQTALLEQYSQATLLAQSLLDAVGAEIPLKPGINESVQDERWFWRVAIAPYPEAAEVLPSSPAAANTMILYEIGVEVGWGDEQARQVSLHSLRLVAANPNSTGSSGSFDNPALTTQPFSDTPNNEEN